MATRAHPLVARRANTPLDYALLLHCYPSPTLVDKQKRAPKLNRTIRLIIPLLFLLSFHSFFFLFFLLRRLQRMDAIFLPPPPSLNSMIPFVLLIFLSDFPRFSLSLLNGDLQWEREQKLEL